jgi:hypothetical protein
MPRGDRTGPWGEGPMTGRSAGYCAGYPTPGYERLRGRGRCRGRGRDWSAGRAGGRGMAWRHGLGGGGPWGHSDPFAPVRGAGRMYGPPAPSPETELSTLRERATQVERVLNEIRDRISELEKGLNKSE